MNLKIIAIITGSLIAIAITIWLLVYYNVLTPYYGLIYGIGISIGAIVVEAVVPIAINYAISPKVSLKIDNIRVEKKTYQNVEGYLLTALVTNKGKKIALNLDASVQIRNEQNEEPRLLNVSIRSLNDSILSAQANEEPFDNGKYAWVESQDREISGIWTQLRQRDYIKFKFPYDSHSAWLTNIDDPIDYSYDTLLKPDDVTYEVTIEVKGEDSEKTTVHGHGKEKVILTE